VRDLDDQLDPIVAAVGGDYDIVLEMAMIAAETAQPAKWGEKVKQAAAQKAIDMASSERQKFSPSSGDGEADWGYMSTNTPD